jgi:DNA-binding MarR family transcriptional regulator
MVLVLGFPINKNNVPQVLFCRWHVNTFKVPRENTSVEEAFLIEAQMKVLKFMSEATGRTDMNEFARIIGLTSSEAVEQVHELAKAGFVRKVGNGYAITEKGKIALKLSAPVPADKKFYFYVGVGKSMGFSAGSIEEFYTLVSKVDASSLEFHLYRGDFENWVRIVLNDAELADDFACVREAELKGENLRKAMLMALDERFSLEHL